MNDGVGFNQIQQYSQTPQYGATPQVDQAQPKKKQAITIIALVILLIIAACFAWFFMAPSRTPAGEAQAIIEDINRNFHTFQDAYSQIVGDNNSRDISLDAEKWEGEAIAELKASFNNLEASISNFMSLGSIDGIDSQTLASTKDKLETSFTVYKNNTTTIISLADTYLYPVLWSYGSYGALPQIKDKDLASQLVEDSDSQIGDVILSLKGLYDTSSEIQKILDDNNCIDYENQTIIRELRCSKDAIPFVYEEGDRVESDIRGAMTRVSFLFETGSIPLDEVLGEINHKLLSGARQQ